MKKISLILLLASASNLLTNSVTVVNSIDDWATSNLSQELEAQEEILVDSVDSAHEEQKPETTVNSKISSRDVKFSEKTTTRHYHNQRWIISERELEKILVGMTVSGIVMVVLYQLCAQK